MAHKYTKLMDKKFAKSKSVFHMEKEEVEQMDEIRRMKTKFNPLDPFSQKSVARQKLSNLMRSGHAKGALIANKMRTLNADTEIDAEDLEALHEVLSKDATASDWIHDFVHSDNPKFEGKTKKERIKMALGAYYAKQRNEEVEYLGEGATKIDQQSGSDRAFDVTHKDTNKKIGTVYTPGKTNPNHVATVNGMDGNPVKNAEFSSFKEAHKFITDNHPLTRGSEHKTGTAHNRGLRNEGKDDREYGYEGDMAISQLKTIVRHADHMMGMLKPETDLPEWVQSKITLATDYMQTAHDYLMSELSEANKVPGKHVNVDNVNAAGQEPHPEEWVDAKKVMKKPVKESYDEEGNLIQMTKTYKEFISEMEFVGGKYVHKGTYGYGGKGAKFGGTDYDNEDMDKKDDDEAGEQKAKRGPKVGSKRGPRTNLGSSKLHQK